MKGHLKLRLQSLFKFNKYPLINLIVCPGLNVKRFQFSGWSASNGLKSLLKNRFVIDY